MLVASLASTATLVLGCASAGADVFGTTSLVSVSPIEQADYAHDPAVSGNGSYVVFDGSIAGVTGVWRRELRPGEGVLSHEGNVEEVAGGDSELPSISENGQYVSFTTNEGRELPNITDGLPDPEHHIGEGGPAIESPDVYVRNMDVAPSEPGAFEPVSAVNGSDETLTYEYGAQGEGENEKTQRDIETEDWGAEAAGRSAISDDGRKVAFVTSAVSNLDGPGTPALEVAVRDLETKATELVSVEYDPATGQAAVNEETKLPVPVPAETQSALVYGAAYSEGGPPRFAPVLAYAVTPTVGASISGDGSTVSWLGQDVGEQAATLPGEALAPKYGEPLWRRVADGPLTPTRRVSGGSDPTNPACLASGETALPPNDSLSNPCQGPFVTESEFGVWSSGLVAGADALPRLSRDGYRVAFIATAPLVSQGSDFGNGSPGEHKGDDLYVADMHEGLTRQQALHQLTELASGNESVVGQTAPIVELDVSPDGNQVAFATKRILFPLSSPAYVTAPLTVPGMLELYDVDLEDETLTRVTHGYEGGPSEHPHKSVTSVEEDPYLQGGDGAQSPSFSSSGNLLAFSSTASNLVFGDGNTPPLGDVRLDGSDAFVIPRIVFAPVATPQVISAAPPNPVPNGSWTLGLTASSLANGEVRLYVEVPGSGSLNAGASAAMKVVTARRSHSKKAHGTHAKIVTRAVASAKRVVGMSTGGLTTVVLTPASKYTALTKRPDGLSATVEVTFSAPGQPTLHKRVEVRFVRRAAHHSKKQVKQ
jgi:hypothetical protein